MINIQNTKDTEITSLNILVYGDPGVGKTSFAATAPDVLIADTENGLLSVKDSQVDFVHLSSWNDLEELYKFMKSDEGKKYKTVAIDTITELMNKLVDELKRTHNNGQNGLSQGGWGVAIDKIAGMMRSFRDLPQSVIFTAHAQFQDKANEGSMRIPSLNGKKLPMQACGQVDIVAYLEVLDTDDGEKKRVLRTTASQDYYAKDRTEVLGGVVPPDFEQIRAAVIQNEQFAWTRKREVEQQEKKQEFEKALDEDVEKQEEEKKEAPKPEEPKQEQEVVEKGDIPWEAAKDNEVKK